MIIKSQFRPVFGFSNPHLQTLLPYLEISPYKNDVREQTLELDDGDFLDLSWLGNPVDGKPIIVIFHGLEGSIHSHYVPRMMRALHNRNWTNLIMHFRGCSGRPNRLARSYHSGETGDAKYLLEWLKTKYPNSPLVAIGFSLGGNMLLKLQAELGENSPLDAAVSICAPILLNLCADRISKGFSRFYQRILINCLNQKILSKAGYIDYQKLIGMSRDDIKRIKTFWEFDNLITAPLHHFKDVHDYYGQSNSRQYLKDIKKPTLMIHALDDPFMSPEIVPDESELSESVEFELCQHGGHIGFITGSIFKPKFWLQERVPSYISQFLS